MRAESVPGAGGHEQPSDEEPVLEPKLSPPRVPGWTVHRERLDRLLSAGTQGPLTVVTGPPGAGKTIAVASWAAARGGPERVAWLTVDRFDNRPGVFWSYLLAALQRAGTPLPVALTAPAGRVRDSHAFLSRLASSLAAAHPPVTLVLDDIHLLTERAALDGLGYVLRYASAGLRLVVASRMDPLLPLHRHRLTGELTEVRAGDLAFRVPEARQLLAQHGVTLPPAALETLTRQNEGWAAGLRLAALSMARRPDPERFVQEAGARDSAVTSYLVDEVLGTQPAPVRELLLTTSILDRVSGGLACELTGSRRAAGLLAGLADANTFVQPLGQGWYRYHSLLAEVLRLKLRRESPGQVPLLHCRAARWLQRNGPLAEAVRHAAAAHAWQLAARIVVAELAIGSLLDPLASAPLAGLLQAMPASRAGDDPASCLVAAALAARQLQDDTAGRWVRRAERTLAQGPPGADPPARLGAALTRFALARRHGDLAAVRIAAARAELAFAGLPEELRERRPEARAQVLACRGIVDLWSGSLETAAAELGDAATMASGTGDWPDCIGQRALAEAARGRLSRAAELAATATAPPPAGQHAGWSPSAAGEVALAWACLERNQLADASGRLSRAEHALRARPDMLVSAVASLVAARQRLARSRPRAAAEIARRARGGWSPPGWLGDRLTLAESQACSASGDTGAALRVAARAQPSAGLAATVALARAQLAAGDRAAAGEALARAPAGPALAAGEDMRLEARLAEAELGYVSDDPARGRQSLEQALRMADRQQLLLPVAMQRAWIGPVLRRDPGLADTFRQLLDPGWTGPSPAAGQPASLVVGQLSAKEREVLRCAARMMNTAEIAGEMYVSVNTVKSHFKSIFRKLGATHRGEAVRRAQQLDLL